MLNTPLPLFFTKPLELRVLTVNPAKLGLEVDAMSWMVFMLPREDVKLVLLNWAIPFWVVLASSMVMVTPEPVALATLSAPVMPSREVTPLPPAAKPQLLVLRQTVPESSGKDMFRLAVGEAKLRVEVNPPEVEDMEVLALPCSTRFWLVEPMVRAPPGVMFRAPPLWISGVVTLVLKVGLLEIDS